MSNDDQKQRRDFLKTLMAGGAAGALGSLGQLALMREASAAAPVFGDYKAMVCVFMYGGNDSVNMLIPTGSDAQTGYSAYRSSRGELSIADNSMMLAPGTLGKGAANPYFSNGLSGEAYLKGYYPLSESNGFELGVNGVMPELAALIRNQRASVVANIGNLIQPVSKTEIQNDTAHLPLFLFAHNHQQRALQTGQADNLDDIGWAGKIADHWTGINNGSLLGLNISYAGNDRMLIGNSTSPLVASAGEPPEVYDMQKGAYESHTDRRALFRALAGIPNQSSTGYVNFDVSRTHPNTDPFERLFASASTQSQNVFDLLSGAWKDHELRYSSMDSYGDELFSVPTAADLGFSDSLKGSFIKQMESVAKMIDMGVKDTFNSGRYNRQIFMVSLGSFDTHSDQVSQHPRLLRELSLGLSKFQTAMEELGHAKKVTTFTMSDFGRTLGNNGDGTDHAWGAHHLVMGGDGTASSGALKGGQILGRLPDLRLGGHDDYSDKGRIIPSLSQDQLNATLCRWFGVDNDLTQVLFPNLRNFETVSGDVDSAYLDALFG